MKNDICIPCEVQIPFLDLNIVKLSKVKDVDCKIPNNIFKTIHSSLIYHTCGLVVRNKKKEPVSESLVIGHGTEIKGRSRELKLLVEDKEKFLNSNKYDNNRNRPGAHKLYSHFYQKDFYDEKPVAIKKRLPSKKYQLLNDSNTTKASLNSSEYDIVERSQPHSSSSSKEMNSNSIGFTEERSVPLGYESFSQFPRFTSSPAYLKALTPKFFNSPYKSVHSERLQSTPLNIQRITELNEYEEMPLDLSINSFREVINIQDKNNVTKKNVCSPELKSLVQTEPKVKEDDIEACDRNISEMIAKDPLEMVPKMQLSFKKNSFLQKVAQKIIDNEFVEIPEVTLIAEKQDFITPKVVPESVPEVAAKVVPQVIAEVVLKENIETQKPTNDVIKDSDSSETSDNESNVSDEDIVQLNASDEFSDIEEYDDPNDKDFEIIKKKKEKTKKEAPLPEYSSQLDGHKMILTKEPVVEQVNYRSLSYINNRSILNQEDYPTPTRVTRSNQKQKIANDPKNVSTKEFDKNIKIMDPMQQKLPNTSEISENLRCLMLKLSLDNYSSINISITQQSLKEKLRTASTPEIYQCYKFAIDFQQSNLFPLYFRCFCEIFSERKIQKHLVSMIGDLKGRSTQYYIYIAKALENCGIRNFDAVKIIIAKNNVHDENTVGVLVDLIAGTGIDIKNLVNYLDSFERFVFPVHVLEKLLSISFEIVDIPLNFFLNNYLKLHPEMGHLLNPNIINQFNLRCSQIVSQLMSP